MKLIKLTCALLLSAYISVSHAAVIHVTDDNGILLGAKNILVEGTLYDVAFIDGSCFALFSGCDEDSDFMFISYNSARIASVALINLVFTGLFNDQPSLTNGCSNIFRCRVFTPHGIFDNEVAVAEFQNDGSSGFDSINDESVGTRADTAFTPTSVFAVWSKSVEVPEPGSVMLLSLGIAGLVVSRRRKQH